MLADFHPKGEVATKFGVYLEGAGITDRATVIIDREGIVRYAASVTPKGERDIDALLSECARIDKEHGPGADFEETTGIGAGTTLFIKSACGFSRSVLLARDNLGLQEALPVRNISDDSAAKAELENLAGKSQAPCLMIEGKPMFESAEIIELLVQRNTSL